MTEVSIDELKQARYMSLTSPPASPEAKRLVDSIIEIILSAEQCKRARQPSAAAKTIHGFETRAKRECRAKRFDEIRQWSKLSKML